MTGEHPCAKRARRSRHFSSCPAVVAFTDNGTALTGCRAAAVNTSTGKATCTTSYSAAGSHSIKASYSGDPKYAASSGSLTQHVK
jgi:hypothetical protein